MYRKTVSFTLSEDPKNWQAYLHGLELRRTQNTGGILSLGVNSVLGRMGS